MSRYYINPSAVTHISYTAKDATVHFIGGEFVAVTRNEAEKIVDKMHDHDGHLEKIVYALDCKLMGRLEDIIQELATPK